MKIVFCGNSPARRIAETGQLAERGHPIEVDDDLASRLLTQDVWVPAPKKEKP